MSERARARVRTGVAFVVVGLALAFLVRRVWGERTEIRDALSRLDAGSIAVGAVLAAATMLCVAAGWQRLLRSAGRPTDVVAWYFAGEIGKYLPGGIWPVLGRGEIAVRGGVARTTAYGTVLVSLVGFFLVGAWLTPLVTVGFRSPSTPILVAGAIVLFGLAGIGFVHPSGRRLVTSAVAAATGRELVVSDISRAGLVEAGALYTSAWLLAGTATWLVADAVDHSATWRAMLAATLVSWVIGFLAVPVPGGLGVREAVFVLVAADLSDPDALVVATVVRFLFLAVDAVGALVSLPVVHRTVQTITR